ncbi:hypothetical protein [Ruminococcus sp.]|uniref:hypothetical protein n=1 Tax=Ruminococcus sp. TaxID=41978 RepID=UPI0025F10E7C|nr:hypothetical protein [Ruminococcus sp.]
MPILKICPRCGAKISTGKACGCYKRDRVNPLSSYSKDVKAFYLTNEWEKARNKCIFACFGLDLISLFIEQKIEYGFTVHHIVPLINDYRLRLQQSNLIYLTEAHHRAVHRLYEAEYQETVEALKTFSELAREALATPGGMLKTFDLLKTNRCGSFLLTKL